MAFGVEFRDAFGSGAQYRAFGPSDRARLEAIVPDWLLELWEADGWAGYRDGLLWTVDPHEFAPLVQLWNLPEAPTIAVARTAFGSIYVLREFLTRKGTKGFATLEIDPHTGNYLPVGPSAKIWTVDPEQFDPLVKAWAPPHPMVAVARTAFGSLYLLKEFVTGSGKKAFSIAEIDPHTGEYSTVGPSAKLFLTQSLAKPRYVKDVLWEPKVKRAARDVGPLEWDEMYGFEPALALGGSGEPETIRRVKLFDHHLMLSQLVELKVVKF